MSIIIQGPLGFKDKNGHPDIQPLQSFFETPQFKKDYTQAGNIAGNYPSNWSGPYEKQGLSSDVRHTLGASVGKDAFIDYISQFGVEPTGKLLIFMETLESQLLRQRTKFLMHGILENKHSRGGTMVLL